MGQEIRREGPETDALSTLVVCEHHDEVVAFQIKVLFFLENVVGGGDIGMVHIEKSLDKLRQHGRSRIRSADPF